ncbi:hypothetical protein EDF68_102497 [Ochrobactrum sp. BH3]|nr:hypothetical protein EDF68_102497 [Ochrobactrum sp. BH3]
MSKHFSDLTDEEEARRAAVIRRARVEGVEAAYESALEICRDKKASSQAKSNASRTLLEIGGMLQRADRNQEKPSGKELHEMTGDELAAHRKQLERQRRKLEAPYEKTYEKDAFD